MIPVPNQAPPKQCVLLCYNTDSGTRPIVEVLAEIAAAVPATELARFPSDFTDQLDHYIYGTLKR
jgi:hypothetical protein